VAEPPSQPSSQYVVRFGSTRLVAEFGARSPLRVGRGGAVIVRSDRGVEWGEILCQATDATRNYLGAGEPGRVLREASDDDRRELERIRQVEREEFQGCREMIAERKMQMQLVDVEHLFGGERLIFYYLSEKRVDFRELVKSLAKRFRTRIEMRQIGVRDEAKLLADYGDCGKPVCCNTHLREMPPVSMKMAKLQKATLDPTKISGRCGRLKCCLRYEYDTYEEYRRELPRVGAMVVTKQGQGKVIGQDVLARKVLVVYEGGRRIIVDPSEIVTVIKSSGRGPGRPSPEEDDDSADNAVDA
jgi:cell fate regulator YaaT (PSP1 superfamily)